MILFPAIDIRGKKVVRLCEGDYDREIVYSDDPLGIAEQFKLSGAEAMHIVDLDGALDGKLVNFDTISAIVRSTDLFVEVGGGIRDEEKIRKYLDAGAGRVILGSIAIENPEFVYDMAAKYGSAIAVGVDAKDGFVAIHGWKTVTEKRSVDFCRELAKGGIDAVIYTDISRDGMLGGTNLKVYEELAGIDGLKVIASGGVTFMSEIEKLRDMGIHGAILGKALYAGKIDLKEALKTAGGN